nr:M64 family metallopeptidase [Microvirga terrestris]
MQTTGSSSNRIDMVFMGDGYTAPEIGTTYTSQVQGFLQYMFSGSLLSEPFGRYQNFFNIHSIEVISNESGADDQANGIYRDTALDAHYNGRELSVDLYKADQIEEGVLPYGVTSEMRYILVNSAVYGGAGYDSGIYSAGNVHAHEIALHEIGHAFANLGDEYDYGISGPYTGNEPSYVNVTADPTGAKWARWLGYDQPGIGVIGAYEGAYYRADGAYRPSLNSKMKNLGQPFDAVSREQFIRKFYEFVDPLDGYMDPWSTKHNLTDFYVDTIDPAVIKVDWTVDGKTVVNAGETFRVDQDYYGFGTHTVTARAYDPTDWVRGDRSALEQSVSWTVVNDHLLTGGSAADRLVGNGLPNELQGRAGSDTLDGGAGADVLIGGSGNDTYYIDELDTLVEAAGGGSDTAYASVSYALGDSEVETLVALGSTAISLTGTQSANRLHGNSGKNTLKGQAGHDTIHGGGGNDTLWGEHGRDVFVFNSKLGTHTSDRKVNFDRLTDFKVDDDTIWLDNAVFRKLGKGSEAKPVKLSHELLSVSGDAKERDDHIIYNRKTGVLSYDADGSGRGRMVEFAQLAKNLKLTSSDFFIV